MVKVKKGDYVRYSRAIVRRLKEEGCFGKGSMYKENFLTALSNKRIAKLVLKALIKQKIILRKKVRF